MSVSLPAIATYILTLLRIHRYRLAILFIGVFIPLYLFGELAEEVIEREIFFFDRPILLFLHKNATPFLDAAMLFSSWFGSAYVLGPASMLVLLLLVLQRKWRQGLFWTLAVVGAALLNVAAKHVFVRSRPDLWISIAPETTYSFPSGHAMQSMAFFAALIVLGWQHRWTRWAMPVAVLIVLSVGVSRMYLGVHYPSDILAGWTASLAWVAGLSVVLHPHQKHPHQKQPTSHVTNDRITPNSQE